MAALITLLASHQFYISLWPALVVVALTLVVGRAAVCGWGLCPLGTLNHAMSWLFRRRHKKTRRLSNRPTPSLRLKYIVLALCLGAALFGSSIGGWLDPIAIVTRGLGLVALPALDFAGHGPVSNEGGLSGFAQTVRGGAAAALQMLAPFRPQRFQGSWLVGIVLLAILAANAWKPRFWCRVLCPLGALLGLLSRLSLLGLRKADDRCTHCGRCEDNCQGADEPRGERRWLQSDCVVCLNCQTSCPESVLRFELLPPRPTTLATAPQRAKAAEADEENSHAPSEHSKGESEPTPGRRISRRELIGSTLAGATLVPLMRVDLGRGVADDPRLIRPPGALGEISFLERCIRCGQCIRSCPTNVIQPALSEGGVESLLTPVLLMRVGYCEQTCVTCGSVCPTGAIRPISIEEKLGRGESPPIRIGTAFVDRGRCLPWAMETPCIVCEEFCPTTPKAIHVDETSTTDEDGREISLARPLVDPRRCVGCGACEHVCPISSPSAIRVTRTGESRAPGSTLILPTPER